MITFKQLEALYWIVKLGSFDAAAAQLNTTQSAVSKRIQELEHAFKLPIFDRAHRTARLTEKGALLFEHAKDLIDRRDQIVEQLIAPDVLVKRVRIGVTELTAMTWLPRWISAIQIAYPRVHLEAAVDLNSALRARLAADTIDVIVVPQSPTLEGFTAAPVGEVENAWMAAPGVVPQRDLPMPLGDIANYQLILQSNLSGTGDLYWRFLQEHGVDTRRIITSNSLVAQISLTLSGLGVSNLPTACLRHMVDRSALELIATRPALPPARYVALHRAERTHSVYARFAQLAAQSCDFNTNLLDSQDFPIAHSKLSS